MKIPSCQAESIRCLLFPFLKKVSVCAHVDVASSKNKYRPNKIALYWLDKLFFCLHWVSDKENHILRWKWRLELIFSLQKLCTLDLYQTFSKINFDIFLLTSVQKIICSRASFSARACHKFDPIFSMSWWIIENGYRIV